jgi:ferredoxin-NADP reductase
VEIILFYSVKTEADIIFNAELHDLENRLSKFRSIIILTRPDTDWSGPMGYLTSELILSNITDVKNQSFFLCGPTPFMENARKVLLEIDVNQHQILEESFGGSSQNSRHLTGSTNNNVEITFARSNKVCNASSGETLLEAAEKYDIKIAYSCRQGQCGTCATRLIEGEVVMDREDGLSPELRQQGYILTCVGYAQGSVKLDV